MDDHLDALTEFGVFTSSRRARRDFARRLIERGVSAADVRELGNYLEGEAGFKNPATKIVALFSDDEADWREALADMRKHRAAKERRAAERRARMNPGKGDASPDHYTDRPRHPGAGILGRTCDHCGKGRVREWFTEDEPAAKQNGTFWCDECGTRFVDQGAHCGVIPPSEDAPPWGGHGKDGLR